ncbi:MAG: hypothetical protein LOY00_06425 [Methylocaldum sp.]|nr:hypothetical protein [Methylocaldum sp.]
MTIRERAKHDGFGEHRIEPATFLEGLPRAVTHRAKPRNRWVTARRESVVTEPFVAVRA